MSHPEPTHARVSFGRYRVGTRSTPRLFLYGLSAPPRAFWTFLRRPGLWRLAAMPILVNFLVLATMVTLTLFYFGDLAAWLWPQPETILLIWLWWLFALMVGFAMLALGFVFGVVLIGPIAAPFIAELSRVVEREWLGPLQEKGLTWRQFLPALPSLTGAAIKRLIRFLALTVPLLLLALVPVVGPPIAAVLEVTVTSLFLAFNFMDAPLSRRHFGRRDTLVLLRRGWPAALGLGLGLTAMLLIPFAGLLVIPVAVQAATLVVLALEAGGRLPKTAPEFEGTLPDQNLEVEERAT